VNGNVDQLGAGNLVVRGIVNGGVNESGLGNLVIDRGVVGGACSESDGGSLVVRAGSNVNVTVGADGPTKGDVLEAGPGSVLISVLGGQYEGNASEYDAGLVQLSTAAGTAFKGSVTEEFDGDVVATIEGMFEGNVTERGVGNVSTDGAGQFKGNSEHELPGTCTNTIVNFEGAACNPL
jgi:hypothetical protein